MARQWLVLRGSARLRWGGDARRRHLFDALIRRTGASTVETWAANDVTDVLTPQWRFWQPRSIVVSAELLRGKVIRVVRRRGSPLAVDIHDDPVAAATALGLPPDPDTERRLKTLWEANLDAFPNLIVPTRALAAFCQLDEKRVIVAPNGTDSTHIRPLPFPDELAIGLASGAAPGRGIETLIDASREIRQARPGVRLLLWLVGTGAGSEDYLESLRSRIAEDQWIELSTVQYAALPEALGRATVLCIPHPSDAYFDLALPIKLADYMAAGRAVVVTPRRETAKVVREYDSGVVAEGDRAEDLAEALLRVLGDPELARRLGANGRRAAEQHLDWQAVGGRLADELLLRANH